MTWTSPSYASGLSDIPLLGETVGANLERTVAAHGDRDAMVEMATGWRWTYREFDEAVSTFARALLGYGIETGDRIGIWVPNCAEWTIVQYAAAKVGAILVNLNPAYRTNEIAYALKQSGTRLLVSGEKFRTSDYPAMIEAVRGDCPALEHVIYVGTPSWDDFVARAEPVPESRLRARMAELRFDDPINIQYTSGTTGFPKGATLSHHNILNNGFFVTELINFTEQDRLCIPVPFYHCFGMVMANLGCTTHGACMVIPAPTFDAKATLDAVQAEQCTALYGVPTMFISEQNLPEFSTYDLSTLRTGIMAGSTCPIEVMKRCMNEMNMVEVAICYGMTETSPVSTQTRPDDDVEHRVSTVGRVMPHVEVKVIDPVTEQVVPRGETGELCTRGYSVMLGYWDDAEQTAQVIDRARWMHTGDLAVMADDGYLSIVGRSKDMVIRGGENIYPREIEEFLYTHPAIADVQVVGVPDEKYGEELVAWVQLRDGYDDLSAEQVREFCDGKITHHKIPRYVVVAEEFPMTVTGKIRKVEMRNRSTEILGL